MKSTRVLIFLSVFVFLIGLSSTPGTLCAQTFTELLARPTATSVTLNVAVSTAREVYFQYGTSSGSYTGSTGVFTTVANEPIKVVISDLEPNTRYYYRMGHRAVGGTDWTYRTEHSFWTQRATGSEFKFTLTSDTHLGQTFSGNSTTRYTRATQNIALDNPDFHIDLGDAFIMSEADNQTEANTIYRNQRSYFGNFSHSAPLFLAIGNHENEEGWNLDDSPFSQGLASIVARAKYFPNPIPDGFYSGNTDLVTIDTVQYHREDYYAWNWGDALFIVLDPFQYTMAKPYGVITGSGEGTDDPQSGDQWNWTLGQTQFNWFKQTLQNSNAKYKFVFSHHVCGGQLSVSGPAGTPGYVRGGALAAPYFEWGGLNASGVSEFATKRPGWGSDPIHQLMVANNVSAFFHGHDHQFVHEVRDGIVYQLVPGAGMNDYGFDLYDASPYVITGGNLPSGGHVRVTVTPTLATVDYVRACVGADGCTNQNVAHTYNIAPAPVTTCQGDFDADGVVDGKDVSLLIATPAMLDIAIFAQNFGDNTCP